MISLVSDVFLDSSGVPNAGFGFGISLDWECVNESDISMEIGYAAFKPLSRIPFSGGNALWRLGALSEFWPLSTDRVGG